MIYNQYEILLTDYKLIVVEKSNFYLFNFKNDNI